MHMRTDLHPLNILFPWLQVKFRMSQQGLAYCDSSSCEDSSILTETNTTSEIMLWCGCQQ